MGYKVITDKYGYCIQEHKVSESGNERWENVGFYPKLVQVANKLLELGVLDQKEFTDVRLAIEVSTKKILAELAEKC